MAYQRHRWDPNCPAPRDLVRPVPLDPDGITGPTRGQARGPRWRQTTHGFYVPAHVDGSLVEQRILETSMPVPSGGCITGVVTGWAALRLHGGNFFDGLHPDGHTEMPVMLITDTSRRDRPGVVFSRDRIDPAEIIVIAGIPCTTVERALFDEMRLAEDLRESVVSMDMAAAARLTSISRMTAYTDDHARWNGVPKVRAALSLADERSMSPNETRMRLIWVLDAGFPKPLVNPNVWDRRGKLLGIADLLDPEAGVVGEFDGADHRRARRHSKDVDREGHFRDHLLEFFRVTGLNLLDRPLVWSRMTSTRSRALFLPPKARTWTLTPPLGWTPELCLDDILDQRDRDWEWERQGPPNIADLINL